VTGFGDNTLQPFLIQDARGGAHQASENQRAVEDQLRKASTDLANAERFYREKLTLRILHLHAVDEVAWTACETIAKGEKAVADLRFKRDVAKGVLEAAQQQAFRHAADRRDLSRFIEWSMRRELRIDTPPADFDRETGEVREISRAA
jgi:hypothetical protein